MTKRKVNKKSAKGHDMIVGGDSPRIVKKNYHITTQTAYHIADLALREGTSEGRIIDKIMRTYLATQRVYNK